MNLMKHTPGTLADRQTILELKINKAGDVNEFDESTKQMSTGSITKTLVSKNAINVAPFLDELDLVRKALATNWIPDIQLKEGMVEQYDVLYDQLAEVNSQLWSLEDQIRVLRAAPDKFQGAACIRGAEVGFLISETNDKRNDLIKKIDGLWGFNTNEKFYQS